MRKHPPILPSTNYLVSPTPTIPPLTGAQSPIPRVWTSAPRSRTKASAEAVGLSPPPRLLNPSSLSTTTLLLLLTHPSNSFHAHLLTVTTDATVVTTSEHGTTCRPTLRRPRLHTLTQTALSSLASLAPVCTMLASVLSRPIQRQTTTTLAQLSLTSRMQFKVDQFRSQSTLPNPFSNSTHQVSLPTQLPAAQPSTTLSLLSATVPTLALVPPLLTSSSETPGVPPGARLALFTSKLPRLLVCAV